MDGFTYKTETTNVALNINDFMLDSVEKENGLYVLHFKKETGVSLSLKLYYCGKYVLVSFKDKSFEFSVTESIAGNYSTKKYTLSSAPSLDMVCEYIADTGLTATIN